MSLGTAYAIKKRAGKGAKKDAECMAKGGMIDLKEQDSIPKGGMETEKGAEPAPQEESKPSMFGMMAKGGVVEEPGVSEQEDDLFEKEHGAIERSGIEGYNPKVGTNPKDMAEDFNHGRNRVIGNQRARDAMQHKEDSDMLDMVGRVLKNHFSRGGMVANDVGVAEADRLPAEYDDLVLRDDLEDDSGAGNEKGDSDVVDSIMKKRKPK